MKKSLNTGVSGSLIRVENITNYQQEEMYDLMGRYYRNVSKLQFLHDLSEKEKIILLTEHKTGQICGFSTQITFDIPIEEKSVRILFSGDTIIDKRYWHSNPLAKIWGKMAMELLNSSSGYELYWLLLSKGVRTYRYLPVFFHEFYPTPNKSTPEFIRNLIAVAVKYKNMKYFNRKTGILHAEHYSLNTDFAKIEEQRLKDKYINFFVKRNPGYIKGDELCCVAPISKENFRTSAYRVMRG
jgi:hypothetical protein